MYTYLLTLQLILYNIAEEISKIQINSECGHEKCKNYGIILDIVKI